MPFPLAPPALSPSATIQGKLNGTSKEPGRFLPYIAIAVVVAFVLLLYVLSK